MKRLILVIDNLGGAGKTPFLPVLHNLLARKGVKSTAITTCEEDATSDLEIWDLDGELDAEQLLGILDESPVTVVHAKTEDAERITSYFRDANVLEVLADDGVDLTVVLPVAPDCELGESVVHLAENLSDAADYLIIHEGGLEEVDLWTGSYAEKVMNYLGAIELETPGINEDCFLEIVETHEMSLREALIHRKHLPRYLRDELHRWELEFCEGLEEAYDVLIPEDADDPSAYSISKKVVLDA